MSDEEIKEFNGYTLNFGYVSVTDLMNYCSNVGSIDCNDIARFPKADVRENICGEWIKDSLDMVVCSNCGEWRRDNRIKHINFCNCCGADMRGGEE